MTRKARKNILPLLISLFFLHFFSTTILAATLPQYREKVGQVYDLLDLLLYPEESLSEAENTAAQLETLKQIRAILPPTDKIQLQGAGFEVDNRWLFEKLQEFENEKAGSPNRAKIIGELLDRLAALETKLAELENQAVSIRTKDEEKQKLGEILKRAEYQKPAEKKESFIQKAIREFLKWLGSVFPKLKFGEPSAENSQTYLSILQIVVFLVVFGIIGFLLYRFAPVLFKNFRKRESREKKTRVILGETLAADETSQNLFAEAENLARNGDLRAAIRKGYIALLCDLSDRKIIGLARHKTNRDYLRDVRNREEIYLNMRGLTTSFERHWYGFDKIQEQDWEEFRKQYTETVSKQLRITN